MPSAYFERRLEGEPGAATLVFEAEARAQQPARIVGHAPQPGFAGLAPFAFGFAFRALGIAGLALALFGGLLAFVSYVLTSSFLVGSPWFRSLMLQIPFGDVYLHNPGRLRYVAVLALPILAAAVAGGCRRWAGQRNGLARAGSHACATPLQARAPPHFQPA